jgi:hypothetical protein
MANRSSLRKLICTIVALSLITTNFAFVPSEQPNANLKSYNVELSQTSVSGISAGAYFATQFHIAYSSTIIGNGAVAGGPYLCALGSLTTALTNCMTFPAGININKLLT